MDWVSPQPFPEQFNPLCLPATPLFCIMPQARSDNNYVIGDCHITRTALTLHTAVPQSYNELGRFVVPHSGMDVIHTVDRTMVDVRGQIVPRPHSKWYAASFNQYGVEDFAWATACQSARALHEFEEERNTKHLPYDLVLMRALNIGLCDTFIGIGSESGIAKTSNDQRLMSTIGMRLLLRQERQYDMVRPPDLRWICHHIDG